MLIYKITDDYITYLTKTDSRVMHNKERPYSGVVLEFEGLNWYVPLTSNKEDPSLKSSFVWLHSIKVEEKLTGYLFFRNMIPAPDCAVSNFDFDIKGPQYRDLLNKQHFSIKAEADKIKKKANTFHSLVVNKKISEDAIKNCCNFSSLLLAAKSYKCP